MSLDAREAWQVFSSDPQPEHTANVSLAARILRHRMHNEAEQALA